MSNSFKLCPTHFSKGGEKWNQNLENVLFELKCVLCSCFDITKSVTHLELWQLSLELFMLTKTNTCSVQNFVEGKTARVYHNICAGEKSLNLICLFTEAITSGQVFHSAQFHSFTESAAENYHVSTRLTSLRLPRRETNPWRIEMLPTFRHQTLRTHFLVSSYAKYIVRLATEKTTTISKGNLFPYRSVVLEVWERSNTATKVSIRLQEFLHWIFLFHCRFLTSSANLPVGRTPVKSQPCFNVI